MSRIVRAAFATALLAAGACGGAGGVDAGAVAPTTGVTGGTPATVPALPGDPAASPEATGGTGEDNGATPTTTPAGVAPTPAPDGAAPSPSVLAVSSGAPGTYHYAQSGTYSAGGEEHDQRPEGTAVVDQADGSTQTVHRFTDPDAPAEDTTYVVDGATLSVREIVTRPSFGGQELEFTCRFDQPWTLFTLGSLPTTAEAGADCGAFTLLARSTAAGTEQIDVAGERVEAVRIDVEVSTDGRLRSTTTETLWFAPANGVVVRSERHQVGTYTFLSFESTITSELQSLHPS